jgi:hypothetical protein
MARLLFVSLVFLTCGRGEISPTHMPINDEFKGSDVVAVARCTSVMQRDPGQPVAQNGRLTPIDYVVRYSILRTYKGPQSLAELSVLYPKRNPEWGPPACMGVALLFLSAQDSSMYALADPTFGIRYFPFPTVGSAGPAGLEQLESDCLGFAMSSKVAEVRIALSLLNDFDRLSKATVDAVSSAPLRVDDPDAAVLRLLILARSRPNPYFEDFVREIQSRAKLDPLTSIRACEVLEHGRDAKELPALERVVDGLPPGDPFRLRECAMNGIHSVKSGNAVRFLIKHVQDTDLTVSHLAIITLAEITEKAGEYGPGMDLFERAPDRYRKLWLDWWEQSGSRQYPEPAPVR